MQESEYYKDIYKFFKLYYTFMVTSVECERIFSHVDSILVKKRNKLLIKNLNILLMISRNGEIL